MLLVLIDNKGRCERVDLSAPVSEEQEQHGYGGC